MDTAKIFKNGQSQAVRLPKAYRFSGEEVYITKVGDTVLLIPKKSGWEQFLDSLDKFSNDAIAERKQPYLEDRDELFL